MSSRSATLRAFLPAARAGFTRGLLLTALVTSLSFDVPAVNNRDAMLDRLLGPRNFDLATWVVNANLAKIGQDVLGSHLGMNEASEVAFVRESFRQIAAYRKVVEEVNQIYLREQDPETKSREPRARRDALRSSIRARQNVGEAILQVQIESILASEGFALGGQTLPPTRFRLTPLPDVLIVSRRDRIDRIDQRVLNTDLPVDELDRIEREIDQRFDVSSFVTAIGGLGAYPTMLPESESFKFTLDVAVHEWVHNYLVWRLAWVATSYLNDSRAQSINETSAVLVERALAPKVLRRFYPEAIPAGVGEAHLAAPLRQQPLAFDFRAEMRETRLQADELLAAGKILEAEAYMEQRRQLFVKQGYAIRKLNQAYFSFYGAYNADRGGAPASGRDPIGPAVQALFDRSTNSHDFLERIIKLRSVEDLLGKQ